MGEPIECYISLRLVRNGEEFASAFGPGIASLLYRVDETGSLNKAAKSMAMAYSKAWRIIRQTESQFGFALIDRDGARGSTLTDKGRELLALYTAVQKAANQAARDVIEQMTIDF